MLAVGPLRNVCAEGQEACKGRSIPMEKLDRLVTERLAHRLLTPDRVGNLLAGLIERQAARDEDHATRPDGPEGEGDRRRVSSRTALRRDLKRDCGF